jgi:hypothetical protein
MPEKAAQLIAFILGRAKKGRVKSFFLELTVRYHESVLYGISFANTKGKSRKSITKTCIDI